MSDVMQGMLMIKKAVHDVLSGVVGEEIHFMDAEEVIDGPYVVINNMDSQYEDSQRDVSRMYWKVVGVSPSKATAITMFNAIDGLHDTELDNTLSATHGAVSRLRRFQPVWETQSTNNITNYIAGGIFRLILEEV